MYSTSKPEGQAISPCSNSIHIIYYKNHIKEYYHEYPAVFDEEDKDHAILAQSQKD